jgi:phage I-like protein
MTTPPTGLVEAFTDDSGRLMLALAVPDGEAPPTEFQLFGAGITHTTKGDVLFDEQAGSDVMAALATHGKDQLPVDYGHGMLSMITTPDSGKAAGWFRPDVRDGALWAADVEWTPVADQALRNREYRFFSPAVLFDSKTRRVSKLINVALTNLPATHGQSPLVASDNHNCAPEAGVTEIPKMADKLLRILGASDEAEAVIMLRENERTYKEALTALGVASLAEIVPAIAGLKSDLSSAETKLAETVAASLKLAETVQLRETELAELKCADEKRAHEALIAELSESGKLPKSLHEWAAGISFDALKQFGEAAPVVKPEASNPNPTTTGDHAITPQMRKLASVMGVPVEKFAETMKADADRMALLREDV